MVRPGNKKMPAGIRCGLLRSLLAVCPVLMTLLSAHADSRSFADLLARAKAQVAAGHRWAPPGDNMTETIVSMMDLISTATPEQLTELSALLEGSRSGPPAQGASPDNLTEQSAAPVSPSRASSEIRNAPALATVGSAPSSVLPEQSVPGTVRQDVPSLTIPRVAIPDQAIPDQAIPGQAMPVEAMPSQIAPGRIAPHPVMPNPVMPNPVTSSPATSSPVMPSSVLPSPVMPSSVMPSPVLPNPGTSSPGTSSPVMPGAFASTQAMPDADSRAGVLFARGLDAELRGDFSGARRFYASAAQRGDAAAARNLGRLYDPAYLRRTALGGVDPDPALARGWYERAIRLGDPDAGPLLEALSVR
jgi:hypothetical protein